MIATNVRAEREFNAAAKIFAAFERDHKKDLVIERLDDFLTVRRSYPTFSTDESAAASAVKQMDELRGAIVEIDELKRKIDVDQAHLPVLRRGRTSAWQKFRNHVPLGITAVIASAVFSVWSQRLGNAMSSYSISVVAGFAFLGIVDLGKTWAEAHHLKKRIVAHEKEISELQLKWPELKAELEVKRSLCDDSIVNASRYFEKKYKLHRPDEPIDWVISDPELSAYRSHVRFIGDSAILVAPDAVEVLAGRIPPDPKQCVLDDPSLSAAQKRILNEARTAYGEKVALKLLSHGLVTREVHGEDAHLKLARECDWGIGAMIVFNEQQAQEVSKRIENLPEIFGTDGDILLGDGSLVVPPHDLPPVVDFEAKDVSALDW